MDKVYETQRKLKIKFLLFEKRTKGSQHKDR